MNPEKYLNVSQTQLSIARHYGGCKVNGVFYVYNPIDDTLTRQDLVKKQKDIDRNDLKRNQLELEL